MRYLVLILAMFRIAHAHQSSTKYLDLEISGDRILVALRFAPGDVTEPLRLRPDATPSPARAAASPEVPRYVQRWIQIRGCTPGPATAAVDGDLVVASWACEPSLDPITLDLTAFFALDPKMEMFVRTGGDTSIRVVAARPVLVIERPRSVAVPFDALCFVLVIAASARTWRRLAIATLAFACAVTLGAVSGIALPMPALVAAALLVSGVELVLTKPRFPVTAVAFGVLQGVVRGTPASLLWMVPAILVASAAVFPLVRRPAARRYAGLVVTVVSVVWLLTCVLP